jgi:zinc finger protein AEBP2
VSQSENPYGNNAGYGQQNPYGNSRVYGQQNPYGNSRGYGQQNPYGNSQQYGQQNSYGNSQQYGRQNPYGNSQQYGQQNPYGNGQQFRQQNPYGNSQQYGQQNPYGNRQPYNYNNIPAKKNRSTTEKVLIISGIVVLVLLYFIGDWYQKKLRMEKADKEAMEMVENMDLDAEDIDLSVTTEESTNYSSDFNDVGDSYEPGRFENGVYISDTFKLKITTEPEMVMVSTEERASWGDDLSAADLESPEIIKEKMKESGTMYADFGAESKNLAVIVTTAYMAGFSKLGVTSNSYDDYVSNLATYNGVLKDAVLIDDTTQKTINGENIKVGYYKAEDSSGSLYIGVFFVVRGDYFADVCVVGGSLDDVKEFMNNNIQ